MTNDADLCEYGPETAPRYDAGLEREALFLDLASWHGMVPAREARRFYGRVVRLARVTGISFETIVAELRAELEGVS